MLSFRELSIFRLELSYDGPQSHIRRYLQKLNFKRLVSVDKSSRTAEAIILQNERMHSRTWNVIQTVVRCWVHSNEEMNSENL